jgi:hypothetical protein
MSHLKNRSISTQFSRFAVLGLLVMGTAMTTAAIGEIIANHPGWSQVNTAVSTTAGSPRIIRIHDLPARQTAAALKGPVVAKCLPEINALGIVLSHCSVGNGSSKGPDLGFETELLQQVEQDINAVPRNPANTGELDNKLQIRFPL